MGMAGVLRTPGTWLLAYYLIAATSLWFLSGTFKGPNKELEDLHLDNLHLMDDDGEEGEDEDGDALPRGEAFTLGQPLLPIPDVDVPPKDDKRSGMVPKEEKGETVDRDDAAQPLICSDAGASGKFLSSCEGVKAVGREVAVGGWGGRKKGRRGDEETKEGDGFGGRRLHRKLSFLQSTARSVSNRVNPFMNMTWGASTAERFKVALLGPVLIPYRSSLMVSSLFLIWLWLRVTSLGADLNKPLPRWRLLLQKPLPYIGRLVTVAFGYHWIKVEGAPARASEAPVVVSNHISFVEAIYLGARLLCMAVSRAENKAIPLFGGIMTGVQCVFVSRTDKDNRAKVSKEIERRVVAERGRWRQLLLFPEGTTTNGNSIISFKAGAFAPGVPVQPVVISYPSRQRFDNSWVTGGPPILELVLRCMCQPHNSMTVRYLPVYHPSEAEKADPRLYAENVRRVMGRALGVRTTDHTFDDVLLMIEAKKLGYRGSLKKCVLEMKALRKVLEIDLDKAKAYLKDFAALDSERRGELTYHEFVRAFGGKDTEELRGLFNLLDVDDDGAIKLREYLTGLALLNEQGTSKFDGAMKLVFKVFDRSGQGRLGREDAARVLRTVWPDMSDDALDQAFAEADANGDGKVTPDEFLEFARAHKDQWPQLKAAMF